MLAAAVRVSGMLARGRQGDHGDVPGPNGGTAVAEALHILEHFDLARHGWGSVEALHVVIEAIRRAAVDRYSYLGDHPDAPFDILPEPNGIQVAGEDLHSAVYPVAKPTHAAGYPGDTLEDSDAGIDAGMLSHP